MDDNIVSLKFDGKTSSDFGCHLQYPTQIVHAKREITPTSVPGVSGDYLSDNYRYSNITQPLTFFVIRPAQYETWEQLQFAFLDWLTPSFKNKYSKFYLDLIKPYHWLAYLSEAPTWTISGIDTATVTLTLNCKPYLVYQDEKFEPVPSAVISNEKLPAFPLWRIVGDGDFTLSINEMEYKLNNIDGEVFIDTTRFLVYKSLNEFRGMNVVFPNHEFPVLNPGTNSIKLTGNYSKFEFKPNWRRLA